MKSKDETLNFMKKWKDDFSKESLYDDARIGKKSNTLGESND